MTFSFKPAKRENVPLLIGLVGGTGSGKTFSAMRLASGIAGDQTFCVIDTENGRASHYADQFRFDVGDLRAPFTPDAYADAIQAADAAGYPVIVVDSASHEWGGDGGILDMQEAEFERMGSKEAAKMASWIKPKTAHKHMVHRLLQIKAHLILCFRAEQKIEMVKENGRMVIQAKHSLTGLDGWIPICEKSLPFELTTSLLFTADAPGIPKPIKLQEQHKNLFPLDKVVNEETGKGLAAWSKGSLGELAETKELHSESAVVNYITVDQQIAIGDLLAARADLRIKITKKYGSLAKIPLDAYQPAMNWINSQITGE